MADVPTIQWPDRSGKKYTYWIYKFSANFKADAGNYIFAKETKPGSWSPVYIGQTKDLSERFDKHHKMPCIKRHGATHIHAHLNAGHQARLAEESDLIEKWNTPCND